MTDPAHDAIAAAIRAITGLVTGPPNLISFDFADLRVALFEQGRAVFGEGEAAGPDRAIRAADAAIADLKRQLLKETAMSEGTGPREVTNNDIAAAYVTMPKPDDQASILQWYATFRDIVRDVLAEQIDRAAEPRGFG